MSKHRFRKTVCAAMAVALLVMMVPVGSIGAAPVPAFVVSEAVAKPGEEVTITVSTRDNPGIVGVRVMVHYDAAVLELKKTEGGAFSGITFGPLEKNPFIASWVDAIHPDNKTNGVLLKLTFAVKKTAAAGKSRITVSYEEEDAFNFDFQTVHFDTVAGGVTVSDNTVNGGSVATQAVRHSVTEANDAGRGLGFLFTLPAKGVTANADGSYALTKATLRYQNTDCSVVRMGALLTTNAAVGGNQAAMTLSAAGVQNVPVSTLWSTTATACSYAVRLKNIPDSAVGRTVYARPYYVVRYQGKETVVYGTIDATSYQKNRT